MRSIDKNKTDKRTGTGSVTKAPARYAEKSGAKVDRRPEYPARPSADTSPRGRSGDRPASRPGTGSAPNSRYAPRTDAPRTARKSPGTEARTEYRGEARPTSRPAARYESRSTSRDDERPNSRPESRSEGRPASRPPARYESRPEARGDARTGSRPESRTEGRPASRPATRYDARPAARSAPRPTSRPAAKSERFSQEGPQLREDLIIGRNAVLEALKSGRPISKILLAAGERQGSIKEIYGVAKDKNVAVQEMDAVRLNALSGGTHHQGVIAMASPVPYSSIEAILAIADEKQEPACIVLLDQLKDPHNLGAIIRTAEAVGAHGILIPQRRGCSLTAAVGRASAGAIEYVPVAQVGNIAQTLQKLKKMGLWVIGTDVGAPKDYYEADLTGPVVIVIGEEGEGISRLTRDNCDVLVRIPMRGRVESLNASVACGLILYEVLRQRRAAKP